MDSRTVVKAAAGVGAVAAVVVWRRAAGQVRSGYRSTVRAVTVNRPPREVYAFWRELSHVAEAMPRPTRVVELDRWHSQWTMTGATGRAARWRAEITEDEPGRVLAWRVGDGPAPHEGRVWFTEAPLGRGTEIRAALRYALRGGRLGRLASTLTGDEPDQVLRTTLRRAKSLLECGGIVVAEEGPAARGPVRARATALVRERLATGGRP